MTHSTSDTWHERNPQTFMGISNPLTAKEAQLPPGWIYLTMADVGHWFGGGTPSKSNPRFWNNGDIPWVSPKDMKRDLVTDAQDHITKDAVAQSATNLVEAGSVLIVVRSGILQHTLPVAVAQRQVALNQDLKAVKPRENIRSDYLALALKAFEREILHTCTKTGTTVQSLALPIFLRFKIPVAPLAEQGRIVAEVDKQFTRLEAGVAALQRVQANLKRYRAAVLKAAFEGHLVPSEAALARSQRLTKNSQSTYETGEALLARILNERRQTWQGRGQYKEPAVTDKENLPLIPEGWTWCMSDAIFSFITSGSRGWAQYYSDNGPIFLRIGNLDHENIRLDLSEIQHVAPPAGVEGLRTVVQPNDILISITADVGMVGLVPQGLGEAYINQHVALARPLPSICPSYVAYYLCASEGGWGHLKKLQRGATKVGLGLNDIRAVPVPLPPLAEQTRIVAELERRLSVVEELESVVSANLRRAIRLRQSILQKTIYGSLVPQDPMEEPAAKLLERIYNRRDYLDTPRASVLDRTPNSRDQKAPPMKVPKDPKSALETALLNKPEAKTASELFSEGNFEREQVYDFYDAIADSHEAVERLSVNRQPAKTKNKLHLKKQKAQAPLRLHELWVKKFKNLEDYIVVFDPQHALDVFLGWNGTGKSNLFEALIVIFRDLHKWQTKDKWTPQAGLEGYRLRYEMEGRLIEITWDIESKLPIAKISDQNDSKAKGPDFHECKRHEVPLPHFVFGYYSGPSNRFSELFSEPKQDHYGRLLKEKSDDEETLANLLQQRRFFNAETHHAKYALLSFFYQDDPGIRYFLKKHLRIEDLESVLFVLKRPRWHRNTNPEDFWGAKGLLRPVLERLRQHAIAPMVMEQIVDDGFQDTKREHYYLLLPSVQHLQALACEYADPTTFFVALESTDFSSIIHEVRIRVRINATATKQTVITFKEMSEGEQQLLMVLGLLRFTKMSQSLVLLDEPDTHLNPHWQLNYLHLLLEALVGNASESDSSKRLPIEELERRLTSQVLLSTHDPLAIAGLVKENIHLLKRRDKTEDCLAVRPTENPRGMGFTGILTSEMFGLKSDLDEETLNLLNQHAELVSKQKLTVREKKKLREMTDEVERLGFKSTSSDPYYRAFLQALSRKRKARDILTKATWNREDIKNLSQETDEILAEIENEETKK